MSCLHPSGSQFYDRTRGTMTCALCGEVVADQQLELDPAFARGDRPAGGAANRAHQVGFARPSRSTILQAPVSHRPSIENARRSIAAYARQLEVSSDFVDMAVALFKLAVNNNSIAGSRPSVLCACLYAICRKENTPHMLFDFAEASKESPFSILGNLKLICKSTNTSLPPPDPSFYVPRMVQELFAKMVRVVFGSDLDGNKEKDEHRVPQVIINFEVGKLVNQDKLFPIFEGAALYEVYCPDSDSTTVSFADEKRSLKAVSADMLEQYRQAKYAKDSLLDNITMLALKILHTMGKEWIGYGRRPVGLCAAAVLVACRSFEVEIALVSLMDISQLSPETIMKRVEEWSSSSAGSLRSIDDYRGPSMKGVPPCYTNGLNYTRVERDSNAITERSLADMFYVICANARSGNPTNDKTAREWRHFITAQCTFKKLPPPSEKLLDLYQLSNARQLEILGMTDAPPMDEPRSDPYAAVVEELTQACTGELAFKLAVSSFKGAPQATSTPGAALPTPPPTQTYQPSGMGTPTGSGSGFDFPTMPLSPFANTTSNSTAAGGSFPISSPERGMAAEEDFEFDTNPALAIATSGVSSTSRAGSAASNMYLQKLGEQVKDVHALVNADPALSSAFMKVELTEDEQAEADALHEAARDVLQNSSFEVLILPMYQSDTFNPFDYKNTGVSIPTFQNRSGTPQTHTSSLGIPLGVRRSRSMDTDGCASITTDDTTFDRRSLDRGRLKSEHLRGDNPERIGLVRSRRNTGQSETDTEPGVVDPDAETVAAMSLAPGDGVKEEVVIGGLPAPIGSGYNCPGYIDRRTYRSKDLAAYIVNDLEERLKKDAMMCRVLGERWSTAGAAKSMLTVKTLEFRACVSDIDLSDPSIYRINDPIIPSNTATLSQSNTQNSNTQNNWSQFADAGEDDFGDFGGGGDFSKTDVSAPAGEANATAPSVSHDERVRRKKLELTKNLLQFSSVSSATYLALSAQNPQQFPVTQQHLASTTRSGRPVPRLVVGSSHQQPQGTTGDDVIGSMSSQAISEDPNDTLRFQRTTLANLMRKQRRRSKVGFISEHDSAQDSLKDALRGRGGAQIDVAAVFGDADDDDADVDADGDGDFGGGGGGDDDWI